MDCLSESHTDIINELQIHSTEHMQEIQLQNIVDELIQCDETNDLISPIKQIDRERENKGSLQNTLRN